MKKIKAFLTTATSLLLLTAGCGGGGGGGGDGESGSSCGVLNAKIYNGETCNQNSDTPVIAVVSYQNVNGTPEPYSICTGTMVTSNDFVTSAHCFASVSRELGSKLAGFAAFFRIGENTSKSSLVTRAASHPNYNGQAGSPYDIAMGTVENIPSGISFAPVAFIRSAATTAGDEVTSFGYGVNNGGGEGELKAVSFNVELVKDGNIFATLKNAGASICEGDSGGPLVKEVNGTPGIIGVNSFGTAEGDQCAQGGSEIFGFVNIQNNNIPEFISGYAGDVAFR